MISNNTHWKMVGANEKDSHVNVSFFLAVLLSPALSLFPTIVIHYLFHILPILFLNFLTFLTNSNLVHVLFHEIK